MSKGNFQEKANFIWEIADSVLRGTYKRNEYQHVILPFTVLKRFDAVLEYSKENVLKEYESLKSRGISDVEFVLSETAVDEKGRTLGFYNYSKYDFKKLLEDPDHIEENLTHYIDSFSKNVKDIFENFDIKTHIMKLSKANLLYLLIKKFSDSRVDFHPDKTSNQEMGLIFEELIRKFSEQSNEEAGEHFTPREVVKLMAQLMFSLNGNLKEKHIIKKVYDPACGTGGMLTSAKEYILSVNPTSDVLLYGQEINDETYAICKADMLIKGEDADTIRGPKSTLSDDQFPDEKFDYIISNPPYGVDWEKDEDVVRKEHERGFDGRFGAGLPRKSDGQMLFLQHMISKMRKDGKSRIAGITNGSPLFTGDAGSGESDIRKWMFENDYIEAIIALPDQLFYNTGIHTYVWILTNQKPDERKGKVQLINATEFYHKMRKSLGNKRQYLSDEDIERIVKLYTDFEENEYSKIFDNEDFGYTKVIVERPMQFNYSCSEDRLENLYSVTAFRKMAESKKQDPAEKLAEEEAGRKRQEEIIDALRSIGDRVYKRWDDFEPLVKEALKGFDLKPNVIKNIIMALAEHDETAEYVVDSKGNPKPDTNLRDSEKIPLKEDIEEYFEREVRPYYPDAWMDRKKDRVGYEINFTQYFYKYEPPRPLEEIEGEIKAIMKEIEKLEKEAL